MPTRTTYGNRKYKPVFPFLYKTMKSNGMNKIDETYFDRKDITIEKDAKIIMTFDFLPGFLSDVTIKNKESVVKNNEDASSVANLPIKKIGAKKSDSKNETNDIFLFEKIMSVVR